MRQVGSVELIVDALRGHAEDGGDLADRHEPAGWDLPGAVSFRRLGLDRRTGMPLGHMPAEGGT